MTTQERIKNWNLHPSMRGVFGFELYKRMAQDDRIWLLVGDLGWGIFNHHREDFPERFLNTGAAEQALLGIACGLALAGKIPVCYSITPFLLYRPFETIRTYVDHEKINVKLIGSGRGDDYTHDGFSHFAGDDREILRPLTNIHTFWPEYTEDIPQWVEHILGDPNPCYLNLRR